MSNNGWIGVDLDRTLVTYDKWKGADHLGEPISPMVERIRGWLMEGKTVKIVTARVANPENSPERSRENMEARRAIISMCLNLFGRPLEVTDRKDFSMIELWDDRCVQLEPNTGLRADRFSPDKDQRKVLLRVLEDFLRRNYDRTDSLRTDQNTIRPYYYRLAKEL